MLDKPAVRFASALLLFTGVVLPSVLAFRFGLYPDWLLSSLALGVAMIVLPLGSNWKSRLVRATLYLAVACVNLSYYIALDFGTTFTQNFFYHLNPETIWIGIAVFPALSILCAVFLILTTIAAAMHRRIKAPAPLLIALIALGLYTNVPFVSAVSFSYHSIADPPGRAAEVMKNRFTKPSAQFKNEKPDLIFIYLESLELTFHNRQIFGDLVPELRQLATTGLQFTNMVQAPGCGWTIAGIVSSQCGVPLMGRDISESFLSTIHAPWYKYNCLAEILSQSGYRTIYMGGAVLRFAGKGPFLKANGFQTVLGRDQLAPRLKDPDYQSRWGLYDDSLLELADKELQELKADPTPVFLNVLTLGTHDPAGQYSRGCPPKWNDGTYGAAVHCTSFLVDQWVRNLQLDSRYRDAVIVLFSDHLAMRNIFTLKLEKLKSPRHLFLVILNGKTGEVTAPGTHFDVAPTILDAIGAHDYGEFPFGQSLLSHPRGFVAQHELTDSDFNGFDLSHAW